MVGQEVVFEMELLEVTRERKVEMEETEVGVEERKIERKRKVGLRLGLQMDLGVNLEGSKSLWPPLFRQRLQYQDYHFLPVTQ